MFSASRSPASLLLVCVPPRPTAAWLLLRSVVPYHSLFLLLLLRPSRQVRLLFLSTSLLSLGYPSPTPPSLFLTGSFGAQVSGFRYPSPAPPRPFWPAILTPRSPFSGTPGPSFRSLFWCHWSSVSTPSFFPTQPSLPGYLGGRLALCAALRFACDFYRSAVFTAPRFLPLRGFYRSAVFIAPLSPVFWGLCSSAALLLAAPQSSPSSGRTLWCRLVRSVSGGPPFLTLFLYRLLDHSRSVTAHLAGSPFVHFVQIKGPSIVSSFECRDTGTACTSTSLWNLTAHGNKAFSPQTDGSAVCRYAYWSMKWLYLQMARSQSVVWFPPHSPDTRSPGPRDSLIFNWNILLHHNTL